LVFLKISVIEIADEGDISGALHSRRPQTSVACFITKVWL